MTKAKKSSLVRNVLLASLVIVFVLVWQVYAHHAKDGSLPAKDAYVSQPTWPDQLMHVSMPDSIAQQLCRYPGFMVSYNKDCHLPNWVAWELTRDEVNASNTHRNSAQFATDYDVEGCAELADYRGSGFDRGHMCPAADMKWSQEGMNACFFLTNICPQNKDLNGGAWNSLEIKCRSWAQRDSAIVIICGPILADSLMRTIGASGVAVPERFFKVVLAPYAEPVRGIGFIMPNAYVAGGMQAAAVSIDEVEAATGYDFFSVLPQDIEARVESECNFPRWSRR